MTAITRDLGDCGNFLAGADYAHAGPDCASSPVGAGGEGAVAAAGFGAIERMVGDAENLGGRQASAVAGRHTDAHRDVGFFLDGKRPGLPRLVGTPVPAADHETGLLDDLAHAVEVDEDLIGGVAREEGRELPSPRKIPAAPAPDAHQARGYHTQGVVPRFIHLAILKFIPSDKLPQ